MLAFLLGSGRGSLPATHHYSYWGADLAICWRALAFTFISDLRTSSILQKQIPWQGQAVKHLMSHPPFAFKHATHLFEKGSSSLWGKTPQAFFCSVQRTMLCIYSSTHPCGLDGSNLKVPLALSAAQDHQEAILLTSEPGLDELK